MRRLLVLAERVRLLRQRLAVDAVRAVRLRQPAPDALAVVGAAATAANGSARILIRVMWFGARART